MYSNKKQTYIHPNPINELYRYVSNHIQYATITLIGVMKYYEKVTINHAIINTATINLRYENI